MKYKDIIKCPINNAPNEKMKSLEDWTLREIKEYCSKDKSNCDKCVFDKFCGRYFVMAGHVPELWNLSYDPYKEK